MNSTSFLFFATALVIAGCVSPPGAAATYAPYPSGVACKVGDLVYVGCCEEQGDYSISYERGPQAWGLCASTADIGNCSEDNTCVVYFPNMGERTGTCVPMSS